MSDDDNAVRSVCDSRLKFFRVCQYKSSYSPARRCGYWGHHWRRRDATCVHVSRSHPGMTRRSARIPQAGRYAVDGELDAAQHLLVGIILRAVLLQKLHLHMIERVEVGKPMLHRALERRVALQEPVLAGNLEQ